MRSSVDDLPRPVVALTTMLPVSHTLPRVAGGLSGHHSAVTATRER